MKNSLRSYILNLLLIVGITVGVLWFALKDHYQAIMDLIANMSFIWLLIILLWGIIYACVLGIILAVFAKKYKKDYRYRQGIVNGFVGIFFSGITPSSTGGQFAQAYIFKKQGIKYSDGASILWADFIIYQTTMMVYVTILFALKFRYFMNLIGPWFLAILVGYLVNVFVIGILWTMALLPKVYSKLSNWLVGLLTKIKIIKNKEKTLTAWNYQLDSFTTEIKHLHCEKILICKTVVLNILRMTIQFTLPFVIVKALNIDIHADMFLDCMSLASFVLMANAFIPIPGASGGTELVFVSLFKSIVSNASIASGVMILWRFSTYHMVMVVGGIVFIFAKRYYDSIRYKKSLGEDVYANSSSE